MRFSIDTNALRVAAQLRDDVIKPFWPRVIKAVQTMTTRLQQYVRQNKLTGGGILEPRTGNLGRSLFSVVTATDKSATGTVGFDLAVAKYGRIQELGGTVNAHDHRLTIPFPAVLTAKGVARFAAPDVISNPHEFGYSGTFVAKNVIFGRIGPGLFEPLFALKSSVTLPAREPLKSSLDDLAPQIVEALTEAVPS